MPPMFFLLLALIITQCGEAPTNSRVLSEVEPAPEEINEEISRPSDEAATAQAMIGSLTLSGFVRDSNGQAVNGLNIRLVSTDDPNRQTAQVSGMNGNFDGGFTLRHLPAGSYKVITEMLDGRGVGLVPDIIDNLLLMDEPDVDFADQVSELTLSKAETTLEIIVD